MKYLVKLSLVLSLIANLVFVITPSANAAKCGDPKKDGKTIGKVIAGKTRVDIKYVDYPEGGVLNPPKSPLNVGLSIRHMPLSSPIGSSLLVWHINYKGCEGKLNVLNERKIGYKFSIIDEKGFRQEFRISKKAQVKKGRYKNEWFQLNGPRQLVLVTCIGRVINGSYEDNLVIIAEPAQSTAAAEPSPSPSVSPSITPSASPSASPTTTP